ncbi:TIGR04282 family arsenosugar biosynthesis glycosyltransferase [Corallibacter sp.]|uniref:TIGR04282 family arsenosugar biosynthesis glycosyltransferase n=1 Tax=Corallibacter sp. TaxID=2038084 RepID=UPI003AB431E5
MGLLSSKKENGNDLSLNAYFPTSQKALIIFTRNPELGKCKTRLAKTIGNEAALSIYKHLLRHTAKTASSIKADKYVFYSESISSNDLWNDSIFKKRLQQGNQLGSRMENAFSELFQLGYKKVLIIGSDLPDLNTETITNAYDKLNENDFVIGPATDGGYYLLGMKSLHQNIFKNKAWSTNSVLKDTLNDLQNSSVFLLKELNDIDTFEDLKAHNELLNLLQSNHD